MPDRGQSLTLTKCGQRFHTSCRVSYPSTPSRRCLHRVLYPVRNPVTTMDCSLLKDINLTLVPRLGPDISSRACRWELPRSCHRLLFWFPSQRPILFLRSCLKTPNGRLRPYKPSGRAAPSEPFGSFIASHPYVPRDPMKSPTAC
jgi:hypothetical protein